MKRKQQPPKEMDIYVLIAGNAFYAGKTAHGNTYNAYKEHARYRKTETADLFHRAEAEKNYPKMYLLGTVTQTQQGAYRYCVAWTRYFMDHGLVSLAYKRTQAYAMDLLPETQEIYDAIQNLPLDAVLADEKILVKSYHKLDKSIPRLPKNEIKISVSHEEYEKIRRAAEKHRLSMSRYCKNMALEGRIITVDGPPLYEYTAEVRGAKILLRQILYAIYTNGKYYPADLENIQKMVDQICAVESNLSHAYATNTKVIMRLLPK